MTDIAAIDGQVFALEAGCKDLAQEAAHRLAKHHAEIEFFWPERWLSHPRLPSIAVFAHKLRGAFVDIDFRPTWRVQTTREVELDTERRGSVSYHSCISGPDRWNMKISHLPHWFSFDRTGYAGWSELANDLALQTLAQELASDCASGWVETLRHKLVRGNVSKFAQPPVTRGRQPGTGDHLFVPLQLENDAVMELAPGGMERLIDWALEAGRQNGCAVVFKRHPLCTSKRIATLLEHALAMPNVIVSDASVHELIAECRAVLVQNSGVGFEAMVHGKPVIALGHSEYAHVAIRCASVGEVVQVVGSQDTSPASRARSDRLVWFIGCRYAIDLEEADSIWRPILRMLLHFEHHLESGGQRPSPRPSLAHRPTPASNSA